MWCRDYWLSLVLLLLEWISSLPLSSPYKRNDVELIDLARDFISFLARALISRSPPECEAREAFVTVHSTSTISMQLSFQVQLADSSLVDLSCRRFEEEGTDLIDCQGRE